MTRTDLERKAREIVAKHGRQGRGRLTLNLEHEILDAPLVKAFVAALVEVQEAALEEAAKVADASVSSDCTCGWGVAASIRELKARSA